MKDIAIIAFGAGLKDGLSPCIFIACAVFIVLGILFSTSSLKATWARIIFAVVYFLGLLICNFGPGQIITLQKNFVLFSKVLYFILGLGSFVLGVLFFKDWVALRRGQTLKGPALGKSIIFPAPAACFLTVFSGLLLSSLATLWPINDYILVLGNGSILRGQFQTVIPLLVIYIFMSMWALWFVWAFLSIKDLRPSFLKILCAAIFFTASSSMIFIFK